VLSVPSYTPSSSSPALRPCSLLACMRFAASRILPWKWSHTFPWCARILSSASCEGQTRGAAKISESKLKDKKNKKKKKKKNKKNKKLGGHLEVEHYFILDLAYVEVREAHALAIATAARNVHAVGIHPEVDLSRHTIHGVTGLERLNECWSARCMLIMSDLFAGKQVDLGRAHDDEVLLVHPGPVLEHLSEQNGVKPEG